jgi:nucleotide-binding universal stress UspA family protein
MALAPSTTQCIVVGYDGSELSEQALSTALEMANARPRSTVHVLQVTEPRGDLLNPYAGTAPYEPGKEIPELQNHISGAMKKLVAKAGEITLERVVAHSEFASPAHALVRLAEAVDADLIVVGTHGRRALPRMLLGSVAELVVRLAGCPVLVVRPKALSEVPQVEPPCPDCVVRRKETQGKALWCERHSQHHPRAHVYNYTEPSVDSIRAWGFD